MVAATEITATTCVVSLDYLEIDGLAATCGNTNPRAQKRYESRICGTIFSGIDAAIGTAPVYGKHHES